MKIRTSRGRSEESAKKHRNSLRDFSPASGLKRIMSTRAFLPRTYVQGLDHTGLPAFLSRAMTAIGRGSVPRMEVSIRPLADLILETIEGVNRCLIQSVFPFDKSGCR